MIAVLNWAPGIVIIVKVHRCTLGHAGVYRTIYCGTCDGSNLLRHHVLTGQIYSGYSLLGAFKFGANMTVY